MKLNKSTFIKRFFIRTLPLFTAMLLASCGISDEEMAALSESGVPEIQTSKPTGTVIPEVAEVTDTLTLSMRCPDTLNPILNEDETVDNVLKLIFKPLFVIDNEQKVVPLTAKSAALSQDGKMLTIDLGDTYFSDGTHLTSRDVIFTLDSIKESEASYYKYVLNGVESYYAPDSHTVAFIYNEPFGTYMYNLCFPVLPEHYYKGQMTKDSAASMHPVGNGDYSFTAYKTVRELDLIKNSDIGIKNIKVIISPDKETDINLFEQGITDAIWVSASDWGKIDTSRSTKNVTSGINSYEFLGMNLNKDIFQNLDLRKAIACAVPSNEIADNIYLGHAEKSLSPINPKSWLTCTSSKINYEYNTDKADEYLKASGLDISLLNFSIIVNTENNERKETAKIIASALNQIGMTVTVTEMQYADYVAALNSDNYDMFIGGIDFSYIPELSCFLSANSMQSGINYMNYSDSTMENLLFSAKNAVGESELKRLTDEIQKKFYEQVPCVGIVFKDQVLVADAKIKNCDGFMPYDQLLDISDWYISSEPDPVKNDTENNEKETE